jgi:hypothetical protein
MEMVTIRLWYYFFFFSRVLVGILWYGGVWLYGPLIYFHGFFLHCFISVPTAFSGFVSFCYCDSYHLWCSNISPIALDCFDLWCFTLLCSTVLVFIFLLF